MTHRRHRLPLGQPDELRRPRPDRRQRQRRVRARRSGRCPGARSRTSRRTRTTAATAPSCRCGRAPPTAAAAGGRFQMDTYCCTNGTSSAQLPERLVRVRPGRRALLRPRRVVGGRQQRHRHELPERLRQPLDAEQPGVPVAPARPGEPPRLAEARLLPLPALRRQLDRALGHVPAGPDQPRGAAAHATAWRWPSTATRTSTSATSRRRGRLRELRHRRRRRPAASRSATAARIDAYAIGWSREHREGQRLRRGASSRRRPLQFHHFLLVTVNGSQVTVTPTDSTGRTFDVQTYDFSGPPPPPPPDTTPPTAPGNVTATAASPTRVDVNWTRIDRQPRRRRATTSRATAPSSPR